MPSLRLTDLRCLDHETNVSHPESPGRLKAIWQRLGITEEVRSHGAWTRSFRPATHSQLAAIHDPTYLRDLDALCHAGGGYWDADTVITPRSFEVAALAAGAGIAAVDSVLIGESNNALCLTRPPGHHAVVDNAMGFCLLNNVAIAAQHALDAHQLKRILIVDWDVHHGNGTQDIFYTRDDVYVFSMHRFPLYPFTGKHSEIGSGKGLGANRNLPISYDLDRETILAQFSRELKDFAAVAKPDLILISAGFDAHQDDPIGGLHLTSTDFASLTRVVMDLADQYCQGCLVSLLEGGYDLPSLAESVWFHWQTLKS